MPKQVVVFMDWQNVYRRCRDMFFDDALDPHPRGQVHPLGLAHRIVKRIPDAELKQVRIYRGLPSATIDPTGYAANRRQTAAWRSQDSTRVHIELRPLNYLRGQAPGREKGIDVKLAMDFAMMAVQKKYDIGVLFSVDSDMLPAVEAVHAMNGCDNAPDAHVAAWKNGLPGRRLAVKKHNVWCHWLDRVDYDACEDTTDYK